MTVIDTHVHVWSMDTQTYPWQQTLKEVPIPTEAATVQRLTAEMDSAGVSYAVLVQPSVYGWDNSYVASCLESNPGRFAGVCLVDVRSADYLEQLSYWCNERGFQGFRLNIIEDPDAGWLLDDRFQKLWHRAQELCISVSFQARPDQFQMIAEIARRNPSMPVVVDSIGEGVLDPAPHKILDPLASQPNVYLKLLCGATESLQPYPYKDLWPFYEAAVEGFSNGRLMFGTDFPHVLRSCNYRRAARWLRDVTCISPDTWTGIESTNAQALWRFGDRKEMA